MANSASVTARDIMATRLITLSPGTDVFDAIDILLRNRISGAPVVDKQGNFIGIFSERSSISLLMAAAYDQVPTTEIDSFIDRYPETISPDADLFALAQKLQQTHFGRLAVIDHDGKLVGQVSRRDVLRAAHRLLQMAPTSGGGTLYLSGLPNSNESGILAMNRR